MTEEELTLLLLCCRLKDRVLPLTAGQYRSLAEKAGGPPVAAGLPALCPGEGEQARLAALLERREEVLTLLKGWERQGVQLCTLLSPDYPVKVKEKLGDEAPAALFLLGDRELLSLPARSLVGSRELREENRRFAEEIGSACARKGFALCSGDARGADRAAQNACLAAGGRVVSFVSDRLLDRSQTERHLFISEDSPESVFSALRAHSRNRLIHCFGSVTFVAQTEDGKGGSWSGSLKNLRQHWTPLYYYEDGSTGAEHLHREGARPFSEFREEA